MVTGVQAGARRRIRRAAVVPGALGDAIDRRSAQPMYDQLRKSILATIEDESLQPGDPLPGELLMCELYRVSRTVVRQALGQLEHDGVITRVKGKGTFVARGKTPEALAHRLTGLYEEVAARGGHVHSEVLRFEPESASTEVAERLGCAPGDRVVVLDRLRHVDGEPWSWSTTWMPYAVGSLVLGLDLADRSLYGALEERGIKVTSGVRGVEAAITDEREGRLLGIGPGKPALRLTSLTLDAADRPIEYFVALHRGDRSRFEFTLRASEPHARVRHVDPT
ncbi:GntR family transcriptional regulator [Georgenia alba]|uniref:GntR family transcriptional regulator n=1 Tax=Georgenia alba TaxID=2233858 RepID=A0ABW2Q492_9MICO